MKHASTEEDIKHVFKLFCVFTLFLHRHLYLHDSCRMYIYNDESAQIKDRPFPCGCGQVVSTGCYDNNADERAQEIYEITNIFKSEE